MPKSEKNTLSSHFADYENSTGDSSLVTEETPKYTPSFKVNQTPIDVPIEILQLSESKNNLQVQNPNVISGVYLRPLQGPLKLNQRWGGLERTYKQNSSIAGHEKCIVNDYAFDMQLNKFAREGRAIDPSDTTRAAMDHFNKVNIPNSGSLNEAVSSEKSVANNSYYVELDELMKLPTNASRKQRKLQRLESGDPATDLYKGPWAPPLIEEKRREFLEEEAKKRKELYKDGTDSKTKKKEEVLPEEPVEVKSSAVIALDKTKKTSIFHLEDPVNFQGFSWIDKPHRFEAPDEEEKNYIPKKLVQTFVGHKMGVQAIRFFPKYGHLLLSAALDGQCKIWSVSEYKKCAQTYMGHDAAIRDIQFTHDGRKFYSCSLDKTICLWDTEYGKIIKAFTNDKIPYCLSVHPSAGMDNVFIIGSANKHAVQFDANTGEVTQEYCEHLATVNTVTFCENGRKLITTADDKKMFVWEFGIPVVVKHIAEPHMRSMPAVRLHPHQNFVACQSMNNQILVYEATGRFRFQGAKRFQGHSNIGYAIKPGFSLDGKFIMSGDTSGKTWFWDWKTMKNLRTLQAHDRVCMGTEWHPSDTSTIATCGWDGLVKIWSS